MLKSILRSARSTGGDIRKKLVKFSGASNSFAELDTAIALTGISFCISFIFKNDAVAVNQGRILSNKNNDAFRIFIGDGHTNITLKTTTTLDASTFRNLGLAPAQNGGICKYIFLFRLTAANTYEATCSRTNLATKETTYLVVSNIETSDISPGLIAKGLTGTTLVGSLSNLDINGNIYPLDSYGRIHKELTGIGSNLTVFNSSFVNY